MLNKGLVVPRFTTACELGFGQGMSVNIHAAATSTHWSGTDFNPSQAGFAQDLALATGAGARLFDETFAEFAERPDLPDFDYIGLHGIWSWISDSNRSVIVEFIRRKLKVGGVLYVSYNTQPGWAAMVPMRELLNQHCSAMGSTGEGIANRIDGALDFAQKLIETNPNYLKVNPYIAQRIQKMKGESRNYLAHEYFNRDWEPMSFAKMANWMGPAKVSYACSANYLDHIDVFNLTAEQQAVLQAIPDSVLRESVFDFMINQQFRKDYWVKGPRKLNELEQFAALRDERIMLVQPVSDVSLKVACPLGEASLHESLYRAVLGVLSDYCPKSLGEIERALQGNPDIGFANVMQAVMVLTHTGAAKPVQRDGDVSEQRGHADRLNSFITNKSRGSLDLGYLASPVTGEGIAVPRFSQLFLLAIGEGLSTPAEWATYAWDVLFSLGHRINKDGKTLESVDDNLAELNTQALAFAEKHLPILRALQVV